MERMAYIKLSSKCTLVLPERVLWKYLPPPELEAAIKRGKAYKRTLSCQRRLDGSQNAEQENGNAYGQKLKGDG